MTEKNIKSWGKLPGKFRACLSVPATRSTLRRAGFSLIELLVVIAILAATAAGVSLAMGAVDTKTRLIAAGEELGSLLETLSARALITRTPLIISLIPGDGTINVNEVGVEAHSLPWTHRLPSGVVVRKVHLNEKIWTSKPVRLLIQPSGHIQDVAVYLELNGEALCVSWNGRAGQCRVGAFDESSFTGHGYSNE